MPQPARHQRPRPLHLQTSRFSPAHLLSFFITSILCPMSQSQGGHLFNLSIPMNHSPLFIQLIFCRFLPDLWLSAQTQPVCKGECRLPVFAGDFAFLVRLIHVPKLLERISTEH